MRELIDKLNYYTKMYDEGHPKISDKEWDYLYFKLVELEKETGILYPDSPTQTINYKVENELRKVTHSHPMLSADKTKDWDEFLNYFHGRAVIGMLKMDGLTCSLHYINGELVSAETRGDGLVGEDVTHNAKVISNIPNYIPYKEELIVDGEIICTQANFKPFADTYKNPRNFASGSIRLLDSNECAKRNLSFILWNVVKGFDEINSFLDKLNRAYNLGFEVVPYTFTFNANAKEHLINLANLYGYPFDGLVGRFDDIKYGEKLGATGHHTKAIYAFKFYDETAETRLRYIKWSMSRNGTLTPIAVFDPIELEGTTISRASLHNVSVMREIMGDCCYAGQILTVHKANEIIPEIVSAVKMNYGDVVAHGGITVDGFSNEYFTCPVCGGTTSIIESESGTEIMVCDNPQCQGKLKMRIDHYASKKGMDIKGISEQTIEKLMGWGWLDSISDIYNLFQHKDEWVQKPGFGAASVTKILKSIEASKNCKLENFISALGIPLIGLTVAKEIVKYYSTWDDFIAAVGGDWSSFEGFGPEMESAINDFDYTEAEEIAKLLNFTTDKKKNAATVTGMIFVITGKLSKKRDDIKADIESAGGKVTGSVSRKTNYLVCNDKTSTTGKSADAAKLGISVISEDELYSLLKN